MPGKPLLTMMSDKDSITPVIAARQNSVYLGRTIIKASELAPDGLPIPALSVRCWGWGRGQRRGERAHQGRPQSHRQLARAGRPWVPRRGRLRVAAACLRACALERPRALPPCPPAQVFGTGNATDPFNFPLVVSTGKLAITDPDPTPSLLVTPEGNVATGTLAVMGDAATGPLTVRGDASKPALLVVGNASRSALQVVGDPASGFAGLTVRRSAVALGPTSIAGLLDPAAKAVLKLELAQPGQALLAALGGDAAAPDLLVADGGLEAKSVSALELREWRGAGRGGAGRGGAGRRGAARGGAGRGEAGRGGAQARRPRPPEVPAWAPSRAALCRAAVCCRRLTAALAPSSPSPWPAAHPSRLAPTPCRGGHRAGRSQRSRPAGRHRGGRQRQRRARPPGQGLCHDFRGAG